VGSKWRAYRVPPLAPSGATSLTLPIDVCAIASELEPPYCLLYLEGTPFVDFHRDIGISFRVCLVNIEILTNVFNDFFWFSKTLYSRIFVEGFSSKLKLMEILHSNV
jgi:hypothetical protein